MTDLGIYVRCHADLICESFPIQIKSPDGVTIHKENLASLCGPAFPFTAHRDQEHIALELAKGKNMCYSREEYESILEKSHPHYIQRDSDGKLYKGNEFEDVFENVCEKIEGKQKWIKKSYEISYNPADYSMFTIAFQGKTCNMLATNIDDFCSTFDFELTMKENENISSLLDELYKTNKFTTEFIFELASLFQKHKGVTDVRILDESCSIPSTNETCHIDKDILQHFMEEHNLGFGGSKKRTKRIKKRIKKRTKTNNLSLIHVRNKCSKYKYRTVRPNQP